MFACIRCCTHDAVHTKEKSRWYQKKKKTVMTKRKKKQELNWRKKVVGIKLRERKEEKAGGVKVRLRERKEEKAGGIKSA